MVDLRQTKEYANYMQKIGWQVEQVSNFQIFVKKIPLLGKVIKIQRAENITKENIDKLLSSQKPTVLYFEPPLSPQFPQFTQFTLSRSCFLPPKTIHIDLQKSTEQLSKEFKPKTRYNIGLAQRRGLTVIESADINTFCCLWKSAARNRGMWLPLGKEIKSIFESFGKNARILFAYNNDILLGGVLLILTKDAGYYMYACSTHEGKKLFAPTLLAWEAIQLAKKEECNVFDFEGIYDERYPQTKSWKGFTKFKEGFGGEIIIYPPTLMKNYNFLSKI